MHSSYTNIDQQYTALWIIKTCITSWTGVTCVIISGNCAWQYSTSSPFNLFLVQFTCIILQYSPLRRTWNANLIKANKWRMITGLVYVYIVTYSMHFIQNDVMTTIVLFLVSLHVCYSNDWTINNLFSKFILHTMHINIILQSSVSQVNTRPYKCMKDGRTIECILQGISQVHSNKRGDTASNLFNVKAL